MTNPPETWTRGDEYALQELQARKQRVFAARRRPVESIVSAMLSVRTEDQQFTVDWLISNADIVRDALKPFDSGVRVAAGEG